jgi:hypothetical protein
MITETEEMVASVTVRHPAFTAMNLRKSFKKNLNNRPSEYII